jgi:hypothetical protein
MYFYSFRFCIIVLCLCTIIVSILYDQNQSSAGPYPSASQNQSNADQNQNNAGPYPPYGSSPIPVVPSFTWSEPMIDTLAPVSEPVKLPIKNDQHIYINKKEPKIKTLVYLTKQEYTVKIKPSREGTVLRHAVHEFNKTLYRIQIKDDDSTRGVWLYKLPNDFQRKFYLFSYRPNENYLAWIENNAIRFKEITNSEDIRKLLETTIQLSNDPSVYTVPIRYIADGIFHIAHIDGNTNNMELLSIDKKDKNNFEVKAKSKLTGAEFSFVTNIPGSRSKIKSYNDNRGTKPLLKDIIPSIVSWELSPDTIKAVRDFEEKGYRHWIEKADDKVIIAKLIETKDDEIIVETFQGKRVTLKINTLIQRDQNYIKEKKKN